MSYKEQQYRVFGYENKGIDDWMDLKTREKGFSENNKKCLQRINALQKMIGKNAALNYFLLLNFQMENCRTMLRSATKQKTFLKAAASDLRGYYLDDEWFQVIDKNLDRIQKRCEHVFFIVKENLKLTEWYPYFEEFGYEDLAEMDMEYHDDTGTAFDYMIREIDEYNAAHPDVIEKHMKSVAWLIKGRDARIRKNERDKKIEKEAATLAKKAEQAEAKEIRDNEKAYRNRINKTNRMFERYWR